MISESLKAKCLENFSKVYPPIPTIDQNNERVCDCRVIVVERPDGSITVFNILAEKMTFNAKGLEIITEYMEKFQPSHITPADILEGKVTATFEVIQ